MPNDKVERLDVLAYTVPTASPESDGTLSWNKTTIVIVEPICRGIKGIGYSYASTSAAFLIRDVLQEAVIGSDPMNIARTWASMARLVRNVGRPGVASMAISAVDNALWDLKAKLLGIPIVTLLGAARPAIDVYGSGGFTSYRLDELQRQLSDWVQSGIKKVKMKVGRDPARDPARVHAARMAIGAEPELFVDANGAYTEKQALLLADRFAEERVAWFEEPVSSDDLAALHLIRQRAPSGMDIAAGEYGFDPRYFQRMLKAEAVDVLQADATRCGGVTGFMLVSDLCVASGVPLSAHTAPTLHGQLCCAALAARDVEYFFDHYRIEDLFFEGALQPKNGQLHPDPSRPGLGIELKRRQAERYAA